MKKNPSSSVLLLASGAVLLSALSGGSRLAAQTGEFGSTVENREALIGILYDFKQTQKREHVPMDTYEFYRIIERFILKGFDESILQGFFRSPGALYTTEIFISGRNASNGPKAFGVEKIVKPTLWLAHYKGQVIPPKAGTYRFSASADGFVAIAINGKALLIKHNENSNRLLKQYGDQLAALAANGRLRYSFPFESDGKTPVDLDILLAEAGGEFHAFVLYQREGEAYEKDAKGNAILPVFQLAKHSREQLGPKLMPQFAPAKEYWRAVP